MHGRSPFSSGGRTNLTLSPASTLRPVLAMWFTVVHHMFAGKRRNLLRSCRARGAAGCDAEGWGTAFLAVIARQMVVTKRVEQLAAFYLMKAVHDN